jgi:hypothetical protein
MRNYSKMKLDVFPAIFFRAENRRSIIPTAIKNYSVNCGFSNDHVSSKDNSAVNMSEDEEDKWHSLPFSWSAV